MWLVGHKFVEPFVVSDINSWSAFFGKLLEVHSQLKGSALNKNFKTQTWGLKLINTASTKSKNGTSFPYFQAVDTGRAPVTTRFSGYIVFAGSKGERITTHTTAATFGYNITGQAAAKMSVTFDGELHRVFNEWLDKHSEGDLVRLARVRPQQAARIGKAHEHAPRVRSEREEQITQFKQEGLNIVGEGSSLRSKADAKVDAAADAFFASQGLGVGIGGEILDTPIINEEEASAIREGKIKAAKEAGYNAEFERLLAKSGSTFNVKDITRQAEAAGLAAEAKATSYYANLRSNIVNNAAFQGIIGPNFFQKGQFIGRAALGANATDAEKAAGVDAWRAANRQRLKDIENNPAIQRLIKIPNWYAMAGIFAKVTGDQIEGIWKPLTPSRAETGNFKLIYIGSKLGAASPRTGGSLIAGYKLVTNNELQRLSGDK